MKFILSASVAFGAALVAAQSAADIPSCALECFVNNVQSTSGCELTDFACQCEPATKDKLNKVIAPCVLGKCSQDDALKTNGVVQGICKNAVGDSSSSASSNGGMMSSMGGSMGGSMTPTGTMSGGVSATFTSLGSVGALGGGGQVTGAATSDSAVSLNGGMAGSSTASASMSAGPQVAYFTAGGPRAVPTAMAAAMGGLAGVVGVLAI